MTTKVILITGTNSGFGWLIANTCAQLGHVVYATMRNTKTGNAEQATALSKLPNLTVLDVDVTNNRSVSDAIMAIIHNEGRIDVIVNNAGLYAVGIGETYTDNDLEKMLDVNVTGPWRIIREALPQMRKQEEGLIVNISSLAGRFSFPFQMAYNTTKFALEGLSEGLHYEVRPFGVDVALLQPGPFPTGIFGKIVIGSDASATDGYGDLAKIPEQIGAGVAQMFEALKPDPQMVADAVVALINAPKGKRPLRTVVDPVSGAFAETANLKVKEQFDQFLTAFGMQDMLN